MGKGLPRSLGRSGDAANKVAKTVSIPFSKTVNMVSVSTSKGYGTTVIGELPDGQVLFLGAIIEDMVITGDGSDVSATFNGDFAIGTNGVADGALDGTNEANIIASTATPAGASSVSTQVAAASNATQAILNNTDGSMELNLNLLIDAADIADDADCDITVAGTLRVAYLVL